MPISSILTQRTKQGLIPVHHSDSPSLRTYLVHIHKDELAGGGQPGPNQQGQRPKQGYMVGSEQAHPLTAGENLTDCYAHPPLISHLSNLQSFWDAFKNC